MPIRPSNTRCGAVDVISAYLLAALVVKDLFSLRNVVVYIVLPPGISFELCIYIYISLISTCIVGCSSTGDVAAANFERVGRQSGR